MAELPTINLALYAQTDVGMVRAGNEDNFLILDLSSGNSWTANEDEPRGLLTYTQGYYGSLLAVSDGMGGALAGEVASRMAVETVRDRMLQLQAHDVYKNMSFFERLRLSIEEANLLINGESQTNPAHKGLGATFTAVAVHGNEIYFAQVGDSRAYLIRKGKISRITKDQSLVQQLIDAGQITEEEAETHSYRNVILQALGAHNNVNVEVHSLRLCQMDTIVLCSDGLSGKIHQEDIARIVNEAGDFKSACQSLINLANERGGEDNITVVIAQLSGAGLPQPEGENSEPQSLARSPDTPTEINWQLGAKTDPFNSTTQSLDNPPESGGSSKLTEPLPPPPTQSKSFTEKVPRLPAETAHTDAARTNDLKDRRGPITSVFAPEEFEESPKVATTQKASQVTAPLEQRQTKPLASSSTQSVAPATEGRPQVNHSRNAAQSTPSTVQSNKKSDENGSKTNLFILTGLILLGVAGLIFGVTSYFKRQEEERTAQQRDQNIRAENLKQKAGRIGSLREKIAEVNKKLQASDKPLLKERLANWHESLNTLSLRLDEVAKISSEQLQQINQECDEIDKELKKIEDEVNHLQGLQPTQSSNREPTKV